MLLRWGLLITDYILIVLATQTNVYLCEMIHMLIFIIIIMIPFFVFCIFWLLYQMKLITVIILRLEIYSVAQAPSWQALGCKYNPWYKTK